MERHKCKLCKRTFANGRALGGHVKAHLATLPLPPKITTVAATTRQQLGFRTESSSSSYSSSGEEQDHEIDDRELDDEEEDDDDKEKAAALAYRLRENPKKSFKFADPEFSFAAAVDAGSIVQDRESETESRNPTRRRSKRTRKSEFGDSLKQNFDLKKLKPKVEEWPPSPPPLPPPPAAVMEPEPVSSVSDTSPEEDVAMCLMMLSRDVWMRNEDNDIDDDEDEEPKQLKNREKSIGMITAEKEIKASKIRSGKFRCEKCTKLFRSSPALLTHRKICSLNGAELRNSDGNERMFECPYCFKVFGSGQALGGHKRSHLRNLHSSPPPPPPAAAAAAANANISASASAAAVVDHEIESCLKMENNWIDLNLPAPMEDDEFSMVSDCLI